MSLRNGQSKRVNPRVRLFKNKSKDTEDEIVKKLKKQQLTQNLFLKIKKN